MLARKTAKATACESVGESDGDTVGDTQRVEERRRNAARISMPLNGDQHKRAALWFQASFVAFRGPIELAGGGAVYRTAIGRRPEGVVPGVPMRRGEELVVVVVVVFVPALVTACLSSPTTCRWPGRASNPTA